MSKFLQSLEMHQLSSWNICLSNDGHTVHYHVHESNNHTKIAVGLHQETFCSFCLLHPCDLNTKSRSRNLVRKRRAVEVFIKQSLKDLALKFLRKSMLKLLLLPAGWTLIISQTKMIFQNGLKKTSKKKKKDRTAGNELMRSTVAGVMNWIWQEELLPVITMKEDRTEGNEIVWNYCCRWRHTSGKG